MESGRAWCLRDPREAGTPHSMWGALGQPLAFVVLCTKQALLPSFGLALPQPLGLRKGGLEEPREPGVGSPPPGVRGQGAGPQPPRDRTRSSWF